jgi:hypothetical protein
MTRFEIALWILDYPLVFGLGIFASIMLAFLLGRRIGHIVPGAGEADAFGLLDGAVFALLGLLFAFTFSAAAGRFDQRRALIVTEANAISSARLLVDLVPADARQPLLDSFDRYIRSRVESYDLATDPAGFAAAFERTQALQQEIWQQAIAAGPRPDVLPAVNSQLIPALNEMFDITTTRAMAMATHAPPVLMLSLWVAALMATAIAGYSSRSSSQLRLVSVTGYAAMISLSIYLIIDFEYPRAGFIRVDAFDAAIRSQQRTATAKEPSIDPL